MREMAEKEIETEEMWIRPEWFLISGLVGSFDESFIMKLFSLQIVICNEATCNFKFNSWLTEIERTQKLERSKQEVL